MEENYQKVLFPETTPPLPLLHNFYENVLIENNLNNSKTQSQTHCHDQTTNYSNLDETDSSSQDQCPNVNINNTFANQTQYNSEIAAQIAAKLIKENEALIAADVMKKTGPLAVNMPLTYNDLIPISFDSEQYIQEIEKGKQKPNFN